MAHSLNNPKAADFMKRTSGYSTHGSRRGYVDHGTHIMETDWNREALILQKVELQEEINVFRTKYKLPKKKKISELIIPSIRNNDRKLYRKIKKRRSYSAKELEHIKRCAEKLTALDAQILKMPPSRNISTDVQYQMVAILAQRSPKLYAALEKEAMRQIARAAAEAVRPDELASEDRRTLLKIKERQKSRVERLGMNYGI